MLNDKRTFLNGGWETNYLFKNCEKITNIRKIGT